MFTHKLYDKERSTSIPKTEPFTKHFITKTKLVDSLEPVTTSEAKTVKKDQYGAMFLWK